jgi:mono/diheme cytochrome c family protein
LGLLLFTASTHAQILQRAENQSLALPMSTDQAPPALLSDTGVFSDLAALAPHDGIYAYELNVPFYSDHAVKTRWFSVPRLNDTIAFAEREPWTFPAGTVWIKHFEMEMDRGNPFSRERLETRLLVMATNGVYGVTYRWTSATNAVLVGEDGYQEDLTIQLGIGENVTQTYIYPSRSDCLACHTPEGGFALGFNVPQLNLDRAYGNMETNQLLALNEMGYFDPPVEAVNHLYGLAKADDTSVSLTYRVRSFLAANCSQCHQFERGSSWDAKIHNPLSDASIIRGVLNKSFGDSDNRVISPGDAGHSVMLTRLSSLGGIRMPPLGSTTLNQEGIQLVSDWIDELASYQDYSQWAFSSFGSTNAPSTWPQANPDQDPSPNLLEFLTGTDPNNGGEYWRFQVSVTGNQATVAFLRLPDVAYIVESSRDLKEWHAWEVEENSPAFSASPGTSQISGKVAGPGPRYFRMKVIGQ